jgi:hypothetical protein
MSTYEPSGPELASTLSEGRQAYIAVPSENGPHVTPELFAWTGGRLWFASAATTLKAKVLSADVQAGATVSAGGRSVLLRGTISRFDIRHPVSLARQFTSFPEASAAWLAYVVRNAPDLLAFVTDTALGRLGSRIPPVRVLFSLEPAAGAIVESDELVSHWGDWSGGRTRPMAPRQLLAGGEPAVAGLPGPVAAPGRWFDDGRRLLIAPELVDLLALPGRFPISVVRDEYSAPGPAAKQGTLLRGEASLVRGERGTIQMHPDRAVTWEGVETSGHRVGRSTRR